MSLSCISTRIAIRMSKAVSISSSSERKNLVPALKNSPKIKQIVIVLSLSAALTAQQKDGLRLEKTADAMGSTFTIEIYGNDRIAMEDAVDAAFEEVRRLDDVLSNYKRESQWSEINRRAAEGPVPVSAEVFGLLAACVEYSRESEGAFDITVGPLMKVWGFYKGSGHLPHRPEVRGALSKVGYRNILLDASSRT